MLYTLNLQNVICQLFLKINLKKNCTLHFPILSQYAQFHRNPDTTVYLLNTKQNLKSYFKLKMIYSINIPMIYFTHLEQIFQKYP